MSPEERELLDRSVELSEENNKMLHSMRRSMRIRSFMTVVYWVIIIGSAVGAYYFIQPYVDQIVNVYGGAKNDLNNISQMIQGLRK